MKVFDNNKEIINTTAEYVLDLVIGLTNLKIIHGLFYILSCVKNLKGLPLDIANHYLILFNILFIFHVYIPLASLPFLAKNF